MGNRSDGQESHSHPSLDLPILSGIDITSVDSVLGSDNMPGLLAPSKSL